MANKWRKKKKIQAAQENQTPQAQRRPRLFDPGWRDRPFVRKTISLSTPEAKSLANSIPYIASASCMIGFALQRYVEDIRVLSLLESVDEEIFKTLGKDLENEVLRLASVVAEEGIKKTVFPNPVEVEVQVTHPYGLEYAKMVENMERLVISLWDLHNSGIIDPVNLNKTKEKWYQLIRDAGRRITQLARDTLDQARQEKALQEKALQDQNEATGTQEEAAGAAPGAAVESPPAEPEEQASPGGNGRRRPKTAKTGAAMPEAEEDQEHKLEPAGPPEEAFPPYQQVV